MQDLKGLNIRRVSVGSGLENGGMEADGRDREAESGENAKGSGTRRDSRGSSQ